MILRIIIWILLAYFAYKFIFNFLVPVLKVSGRMRRQMKEFQQRAEQQQPPVDPPSNNTSTSKIKAGEYIDFEEVKEK
jgi:hypothetical protein